MLHDPGSYSPPLIIDEIKLGKDEEDVLKSLGAEIARISSDPINKERARLWTGVNDLKGERPVVWINEIPWHEMNVDDELTLRTRNPWARGFETTLRRTVYQWKHMAGDMVVNPWIDCPLASHSTDFGIVEDVDIARTDSQNEIVSRHFKIQIKEPEDILKIKMPTVTHVEKTTAVTWGTMQHLFKDIIEVRKQGQTHIWFTPWDYLIRWWGIEEAMIDMVDRPDMVHAAYERMVDAWMIELDQFVEQNLLSLDCANVRIGSGGYGYTSQLPGSPFDPARVGTKNMWGCSNAQILTSVSPEMHWEFAMEHDLRWLRRWGLNYYGCCEPLDRKIAQLERLPNLRKVSASPWNDWKRLFSGLGDRYVASVKPNPAIFLDEAWSPEEARKTMTDILDVADAEGCTNIELIMKDISTVHRHPQRLWKWADIAMEVARSR
jgi:hypothetical protein